MQGTVNARVMRGEGPCTKPNGAALSMLTANRLDVRKGDLVDIEGSRKTVAVIESVEDLGEAAVYLGRITRLNCGAHWDEEVKISRLEKKKDAERIVLGPASPENTLDCEADAIRSILIGHHLSGGDILEISSRSHGLRWRTGIAARFIRIAVLSASPAGIVRVTGATRIDINPEFRENTRLKTHNSYDDIGGITEIIQKIREVVELPLRNPDLFTGHFGTEPPKGVLMHGAPGSGKTLLAKAVASECDAYFINLGVSYLPAHDAERRLREAFAEAEQHAPSILFLDEIDFIARKREEALNPEDRRTVGTLLELMDGMKARGQVIIMGATNQPNTLDAALRRPGRFDREIEFPIPNEEGREEILRIHTRHMPLEEGFEPARIAETTHGYSGADLRLLCTEATLDCVRRYQGRFNPDGTIPGKVVEQMLVTTGDFTGAMRSITPSCGREFIAEIPKIPWDSVGGYADLKEQVSRRLIKPWKKRKESRDHGIRVPKGILLYGPPGTGKTYFAQAIATEAGVKVITASGAGLKSKWFGEYEANIRKLFETARKAAPVIMIIDEVESIASARSGGGGEGGKALDSGTNELLLQIDGVKELHDVFIICTTNRRDMIDRAFTRSGRVELAFEVYPPDEEARRRIFEIHLAQLKAGVDRDASPEKLAGLTGGMVGADIERICRTALLDWFCDNCDGIKAGGEQIGIAYFERAISEVCAREGREDEALLLPLNA